jgi:hypothetical protein
MPEYVSKSLYTIFIHTLHTYKHQCSFYWKLHSSLSCIFLHSDTILQIQWAVKKFPWWSAASWVLIPWTVLLVISSACFAELCDAMERTWHGQWVLHHDNAYSDTSLVMQQFLTGRTSPAITQPSYSQDLGLRTFWLFIHWKWSSRGTRLGPVDDVKFNVTSKL